MSKRRKTIFIEGPPGPMGPMGSTGIPGPPLDHVPFFVTLCRYVLAGAIVAGFAFALLLIGITIAHAQYQHNPPPHKDHWHHDQHSRYHDQYNTWCQPNYTGAKPCPKPYSCCDAREEKDGTVEGHCYWTQAELRKSKDPTIKYPVWWVLLDTSVWEEIPNDKIIHEKNPDETGTAAHICEIESTQQILCFLPPTGVQ
jgi:hypothetical protein